MILKDEALRRGVLVSSSGRAGSDSCVSFRRARGPFLPEQPSKNYMFAGKEVLSSERIERGSSEQTHARGDTLAQLAAPRRPCIVVWPTRNHHLTAAAVAMPALPAGPPLGSPGLSRHRACNPPGNPAAAATCPRVGHQLRDSFPPGPIPRIWSAPRPKPRPLRAAPSDEGPGAPGSVVGAMAMVTSSTVGAGILALPTVTAPAGFVPSASALLGVWVLLCAEAVFLADVCCFVRERRAANGDKLDGVVSITDMARETLGGRVAGGVTALYVALEYTLLVAYLSKGGDVLGQMANAGGVTLPSSVSGAVLAGAVGALAVWGGTQATDRANRVMTALLLTTFAAILAAGAPTADFASLMTRPGDWASVPSAVPVIFLALVYHDLVPVVCAYLGGDRARIRTALFAGSLGPLAMFLAWDAVSLGQLAVAAGPAGIGGPITDPLALLMTGDHGTPWLPGTVLVFSLTAIATSLCCTALALLEYLNAEVTQAGASGGKRVAEAVPAAVRAVWARMQESRTVASVAAAKYGLERVATSLPSWQRRLACAVLALGPPLCVAQTSRDAFLGATQVAGGYLDTALYGILPPAMILALRSATGQEGAAPRADVPGGTGALVGVAGAALAIGLSQAANDFARTGSAAGPVAVTPAAVPPHVHAAPAADGGGAYTFVTTAPPLPITSVEL